MTKTQEKKIKEQREKIKEQRVILNHLRVHTQYLRDKIRKGKRVTKEDLSFIEVFRISLYYSTFKNGCPPSKDILELKRKQVAKMFPKKFPK